MIPGAGPLNPAAPGLTEHLATGGNRAFNRQCEKRIMRLPVRSQSFVPFQSVSNCRPRSVRRGDSIRFLIQLHRRASPRFRFSFRVILLASEAGRGGQGGGRAGWQGGGRLSESLRVILCKGKSASDTVFGNNVDHDFTCAQASDRAGIIQFSTYVI